MLDRVIDVVAPLAARHLWQVTLTVALLVLLARGIGRRSAHWAYAILIVAALKCLCPPIWSLAVSPFCWYSRGPAVEELAHSAAADHVASSEPANFDASSVAVTSDPNAELVHTGYESSESAASVAVELTSNQLDLKSPTIGSGKEPRFGASPVRPPSTIPWIRIVQGTLIAIWIAGSLLVLLGVVIKRGKLAALVSRGQAVTTGPIFDLVDRLRQDLGLTTSLKVVILDEPGVPGVFGMRAPTVVLPRLILDRMDHSELRLVLAHELNHLRRQDTFCGALQLLAIVAWWFHPLVWWMNSNLRRFREHCCDEEVVARLNCRPAEYARCLLNVLSLKQELHPVVGVSALSPFDVTAQRLQNLMRQERSFSQHRSWWCVAVSALLAIMLLPGAALPRDAAVDVVESLPSATDGNQSDPQDASPIAHLYRSGIVEPEPTVPDAAIEPAAPPEVTYGFQPGESCSYHLTIEADEPEGVVTCDGTIAWQVHEVNDGELMLSRQPTAIVRSQSPRMQDGHFTLPTAPRVTWHGTHGGPFAPPEVRRFPGPAFPRGLIGSPPNLPERMEPFGPPRQQQGEMERAHPATSFPGSPFSREADRFSLAGGSIQLGDPCWMPYLVGDAIDWILSPLPAALDGGRTERLVPWTLENESQMPRFPFGPTPVQAQETATWQVVERREGEWTLMREVDRWSNSEGAESPDTARYRLQGTALITWAVDLGRPIGVEFSGKFLERAGGSVVTMPINVTATRNQ